MKLRMYITIFLLILLSSSVFAQEDIHESITKVYLANTDSSGLFLLSAKVKSLSLIELEYTCDFNSNDEVKYAEVAVGVLSNDSSDIKELKSVKIKCDLLMGGKHSYKQAYSLSTSLKQNSTIVFWVKNIISLQVGFISYNKEDLLHYIKVVEYEQLRLTEIAAYNTPDDLAVEVCRNQEE